MVEQSRAKMIRELVDQVIKLRQLTTERERELREILLKLRDSEDIESISLAIDVQEMLKREESILDEHDLHLAYVNRGLVRKDLTDEPDALVDFDIAIAVLERVKKKTNALIEVPFATALMRRAQFKEHSNDIKGAIVDYDSAIKIWKSLSDKRESRDYEMMALTYVMRARAKGDAGDFSVALKDYNRAFEILGEGGKPREIIDENNLAAFYGSRGNVKWELQDRVGAQNDYERGISILQKLQEEGKSFNQNNLRTFIENRNEVRAELEETPNHSSNSAQPLEQKKEREEQSKGDSGSRGISEEYDREAIKRKVKRRYDHMIAIIQNPSEFEQLLEYIDEEAVQDGQDIDKICTFMCFNCRKFIHVKEVVHVFLLKFAIPYCPNCIHGNLVEMGPEGEHLTDDDFEEEEKKYLAEAQKEIESIIEEDSRM